MVVWVVCRAGKRHDGPVEAHRVAFPCWVCGVIRSPLRSAVNLYVGPDRRRSTPARILSGPLRGPRAHGAGFRADSRSEARGRQQAHRLGRELDKGRVLGVSRKTSAIRPSAKRPNVAVHLRPPCSKSTSSETRRSGRRSRSDITRLPFQTGECDQAGLGAVDVALAGEKISAGRPPGDCACAGQVLVLGAGRNVREPFGRPRNRDAVRPGLSPTAFSRARRSMTPRARPKANAATFASVGRAPTNSQ